MNKFNPFHRWKFYILASITHYHAVPNIDPIIQHTDNSTRIERVQLHARTHARILKFKKPSPLIRSRDNFRYVIFSKRSSIWPLRIATCIQISDNGSYYREYKEFKYEIWSPRSIITSNNSRSIQFEWLPSEVMFEKKKRREKKIGRGLSWNRR